MARGWESKSVESQMEDARTRKDAKPAVDAAAQEKAARLASLELQRQRILREMQAACNPRFRGQLEAALAHLEAELERQRS